MTIIKHLIGIMIIVIGFSIPKLHSQPADLILNNMTFSTTETYNAINSITAGPNFTITSSGNVTFGTPNVNLMGEFVIESGGLFTVVNGIVNGIETLDDYVLPTEFDLYQNYPNPFNPTTTFNYQVPEISFITLKVYDVLGNIIANIVNEEKTAGKYQVEFDGSSLASGIYFYQLQAGSFIETKKMVLMK